MDEHQLARALAVHTARLRAVDPSTDADLWKARTLLAGQFAAHGVQMPTEMDAVPTGLLTELTALAAQVLAELATFGADAFPLATLTPLDAGEPARRVNGRAVATRLGPFADSAGTRYWCESFQRKGFDACASAPGAIPFLLADITGPDGEEEFVLGPGSLWVRADTLAPGAVGWAGLRIASGTLRFDAPAFRVGQEIVMPPAAGCTVQIELAPAPAPASGPPDLAGAEVRRPAQVSIRIPAHGTSQVTIGGTALEVFGARLEFGPAAAPAIRRSDIPLSLLIPIEPTGGKTFTPATVQSRVLSLSGRSTVADAFWALPLAKPDHHTELGEAADAGDLVVLLGKGLRLGWPGLARPDRVPDLTVLRANSSALRIDTAGGQGRALAQSLRFGDGSQADLGFDPAMPVRYRAEIDRETTFVPCTVEAVADPPVHADGQPMMFSAHTAHALFSRFSTEPDRRWIHLRGDDDETDTPPRTLALVNGLIGMGRPAAFTLSGILDMPARAVESGRLQLRAALHWILPTLPDPYAANFALPERGQHARRTFTLAVDWVPQQVPRIEMDLGYIDGDTVERMLPAGGAEPARDPEELEGIFDGRPFGPRMRSLMLLDVSTNADRFGVATAYPEGGRALRSLLTVEALHLCSPADLVQAMTLPVVQWETVWNEPNPLTLPFPDELGSTSSGGPALMRGDSVRLVPLAPIDVADEAVTAYAAGSGHFAMLFTLPFGIRAAMHTGLGLDRPQLEWILPEFEGVFGARQLSVLARGSGLPGAALQTDHGVDDTGAVHNVLDPDIDSFFNNRFGPGTSTAQIPVSRIDISGYGASGISRWDNPSPAMVDVTKVHFDVLIGRTAREVVQVQSILWPSQAIVVRSVTMTRAAGGRVIRRDSGWQAVTPGLFRHPNSTCVFHTGAVRGYHDIRQIRDTSLRVTVTDPATGATAELVAVYFDCDVAVEHTVKGHREETIGGQQVRLTGSLGQLGFVQVWPDGQSPPGPLTPGQLADLFRQHGALGGPLDCEIDIGGSGQRMRLSGVSADTAPATVGLPEFAVQLHGSLRLPGAGQWSAVRVRKPPTPADDRVPEAMDSGRGLPLIRRNGPDEPYRFADPHDLLRADPDVEYGLLFCSPAHRLLFRRPHIKPGTHALTTLQVPLLADSYAVASGVLPFPGYRDAIPLPSNTYALDVVGEAQLRLSPNPVSFHHTGQRELSHSGQQRLFVEYQNTKFDLAYDSTQPAQPWTYRCERPAVVCEDGKLGRVSSGLTVQEGLGAIGLLADDMEVQFGQSMEKVTEVINILEDFGLEVEPRLYFADGDLVIKLSLSTEHGLFPRTPGAGNSPSKHKKRLETGVWKLAGEIEFEIRVGRFPGKSGVTVEIKGEIQEQTPLPKVYLGGFLEFRYKTETDHRTKKSDNVYLLAAGCVGSIGGQQLIPELVEAEITVRRGYVLDHRPDEPDITQRFRLGVVMGLEVQAALKCPGLGDVVRVGFEWEGRALMYPEINGLLDSKVWITATVRAAFNVGVAFVDFEFEKEFEHRQSVPMALVGGLAAAVALGYLPPP